MRDTRLVFAVQERDIEHLLRVIAPILKHLLVLEVRVLDVAVLFELLNIDLGLGHCGLPAIICERDAVAKPLDRSLEDLKEDVLNVELFLKVHDVLLFLAGEEGSVGTGPHILARLAHIAPKAHTHIVSYPSNLTFLETDRFMPCFALAINTYMFALYFFVIIIIA